MGQSSHFWLFLLSLWLPLVSSGQVFNEDLFEKTDHIEVPFQYVNGFIIVNVLYEQMMPLKFIFDTGAEYTILSYPEIALIGNARIGRSIQIYGADMKTKIDAYVLKGTTLDVGKKFYVTNTNIILLKDKFLDFDKYVGFPIHGILGASLFSRFIIEINYLKRVITFHNPKSPIDTRHFTEIPVSFHSRKPYIYMTVELPDSTSFKGKYLLDSGADLSLLMLLGSHKFLTIPKGAIASKIANGLGGNMKGYLGRIHNINLAKTILPSPIVHYQKRPDSLFQKNRSNGIIGNKVLSLFRVVIDYPSQKVYLKAISKRRRSIKQDRSGLFLIASGPLLRHISIAQVIPTSPAALAGLKSGDQLIKINGWKTKFYTLGGITQKLEKRAGKKIRLTILRDGKKMKFTFQLKDYI